MLDIVHTVEYPGHNRQFGVVTLGGGRYWPSVVVSCHRLREHGYLGPIQVWHGLQHDPEPIDPRDVDDYDVEIVDTRKHAEQTKPRILRGWEAKWYVIRHCDFERILFLDADAYCIRNPQPMLEQLTEQASIAYWPDICCDVGSLNWDICCPDADRSIPPIQGGHLLFDRPRAWPAILLTDWLCQHSDFYFRWAFGDQDCLRLALGCLPEVTRREVGRIEWVHPAFVCYDHKNQPAIVHRCQGKLMGPRPHWNQRLPDEEAVQARYQQMLPPTLVSPVQSPAPTTEEAIARRLVRRIVSQRAGQPVKLVAISEHPKNGQWLARAVAQIKAMGQPCDLHWRFHDLGTLSSLVNRAELDVFVLSNAMRDAGCQAIRDALALPVHCGLGAWAWSDRPETIVPLAFTPAALRYVTSDDKLFWFVGHRADS